MRSRSILILVTLLLLGSATTGHTVAQTPDATPGASDRGAWQVGDARTLDPDAGRYSALSPDGAWLAGVGPDHELCVWETETITGTCAEDVGRIRPETITWSPDGTAVAFALDGVRLGRDSDILVYERGDGTVKNLTDDGTDASLIRMEPGQPYDDAPAWSPDSQELIFSRSFPGDEAPSTTIMRIDREGGEATEVHRLALAEVFTVWMPMHWLPDGTILYTQASVDRDNASNGVWRIHIDGNTPPSHLVPGADGSDVPIPLIMDVDPGSGHALLFAFGLTGASSFEPPEEPQVWMLDIATGAVTPVPHLPAAQGEEDWMTGRAHAATFSPDGEWFIAAYSEVGTTVLAVTETRTGATTLLDRELVSFVGTEVPAWGANNTVLLPNPSSASLVTLVPPAGADAQSVEASSVVPQASPVATPAAGGDGWQITDVRQSDVDGEFAALSPDGRWLAGIGPDRTLCVWDVESMASECVDERLRIREETITWSPDSTAVAFSFNAILYAEESDIYVYEVDTGTLTNLTDDGVEGSLLDAGDADAPIDDVPTWSPDSQRIAFARSYTSDELSSTNIMQIDRSGGEPVEIIQLDVEQPLAVWMPMHWLPDGTLLYTQLSHDLDDPRNGVWKIGIDDGSSPLQVVPGDSISDVPGPMVVDVDAGQGSAIVYSYMLAGQFGFDTEQTLFWMVDLESGDMQPLVSGGGASDAMVIAAGFSPDGGAVMLVTMVGRDSVLKLMDPATGEVTQLEHDSSDTIFVPGAVQWAENDMVLIQGHRRNGPVLFMLDRAD